MKLYTTPTTWSRLPNAKHIDRVLASLKANPEKWSVVRNAAWNAALGVAWDAAWNVTTEAASRAISLAISWATEYDTARGAIVALIAYDDCAYMLDSDVNELRIIAALGDPRAILLLPACIVFNELKII